MTVMLNNFPMERGKRIKLLRDIAGLDRKKMSEFGKFGIPALKGWELGLYGGLNDTGAKKILDVSKNNGIEATYDWLMYGVGSFPIVDVTFGEIKKEINAK